MPGNLTVRGKFKIKYTFFIRNEHKNDILTDSGHFHEHLWIESSPAGMICPCRIFRWLWICLPDLLLTPLTYLLILLGYITSGLSDLVSYKTIPTVMRVTYFSSVIYSCLRPTPLWYGHCQSLISSRYFENRYCRSLLATSYSLQVVWFQLAGWEWTW